MTTANAWLEAEIMAIVKQVSRRPVEPTPESDRALDLGFDSLLVFELIAELEDRFDRLDPTERHRDGSHDHPDREHLRDLITRQNGSL